MTVVVMGQMSLENQVEKSEKKNDQDQVDGMRQEVYSGLRMTFFTLNLSASAELCALMSIEYPYFTYFY